MKQILISKDATEYACRFEGAAGNAESIRGQLNLPKTRCRETTSRNNETYNYLSKHELSIIEWNDDLQHGGSISIIRKSFIRVFIVTYIRSQAPIIFPVRRKCVTLNREILLLEKL